MNTAAFYKLSYGLYVVSSRKGDKLNGQIANTVFQVTSDPPTIAISINKENLTGEFIKSSRKFAVSVLSQSAPMPFIGLFGFKSGKEVDKFAGVKYRLGAAGIPVLTEQAVAYVEAEVINELDCGTHTIFVGKIIDGDVINNEEPMTYAYYHEVKRGKSPKTAPTYISGGPAVSEKIVSVTEKPAVYTCSVCGYVYDPDTGDADSGMKPGVDFRDLPEDWTCPVCGADKSQFEK
jgi:flavin reductase (DIM6/NTAB) family NADH-FMN oxidoreductase RutF